MNNPSPVICGKNAEACCAAPAAACSEGYQCTSGVCGPIHLAQCLVTVQGVVGSCYDATGAESTGLSDTNPTQTECGAEDTATNMLKADFAASGINICEDGARYAYGCCDMDTTVLSGP